MVVGGGRAGAGARLWVSGAEGGAGAGGPAHITEQHLQRCFFMSRSWVSPAGASGPT